MEEQHEQQMVWQAQQPAQHPQGQGRGGGQYRSPPRLGQGQGQGQVQVQGQQGGDAMAEITQQFNKFAESEDNSCLI